MKDLERLTENFRDPDRRYGVCQIIHTGVQDLSRAEYYDRRGFAGI